MSPEQAEGKQIDARSDIFSFGAVLYEMLTGRRAFEGDTPMSTIASVINREPKAVTAVVDDIPREAERIVARCLRKDPARRFQTMGDLKVALLDLKEESESGTLTVGASAAPRRKRPYLWITLGLILTLAGAAALWRLRGVAPAPAGQLNVVPLTALPGMEMFPTFSPDGNQLAFTWRKKGERNNGLYVKMVGPGAPLRLAAESGDYYAPAWSPDGRWIGFLRAIGKQEFAVTVVAPLGGQERQVGEIENRLSVMFAFTSDLGWTPYGKWLVAAAGLGGQDQRMGIVLLSPETGERRQITTPDDARGTDTAPSFSPDGQKLVFGRHERGKSFLLVHDLTRDYSLVGTPRRIDLNAAPGLVNQTAWMPDGRDVLMFRRSENNGSLWRVRADGGSPPEQLTWAGEDVRRLALGRPVGAGTDGTFRLAFARMSNRTNLWRYSMPGPGRQLEAPLQVTASTRIDRTPAVSPDGTKLAFTSDRSGTFQIWVCETTGANPVQVTDMRRSGADMPRWSPDGRQLLYGMNTEPRELYIVAASGGTPRKVSTKTIANHALGWSNDGKAIYFVSHAPSTEGLWRLVLAGGEERRISLNVGHDLQESVEGRFVYFTMSGGPGLGPGGWGVPGAVRQVPIAGGEETELIKIAGERVGYTRDGFYYETQPEPVPHRIYFYNFATGASTPAGQVQRSGLRNMAASPDGRWVFYPEAEHTDSDLYMAENFR